jgi:catechol 2,3-dioxygenase-like lactoylglutathione lyase family enzyme
LSEFGTCFREGEVKLNLTRVMLFTRNMPAMLAFYRDVLGLPVVTDEKGFKELDAGGCRIALHNGGSIVGSRPPKLVFFAADVEAVRATLTARGAKLGAISSGGGLARCDGRDPDGNHWGLSDRQ